MAAAAAAAAIDDCVYRYIASGHRGSVSEEAPWEKRFSYWWWKMGGLVTKKHLEKVLIVRCFRIMNAIQNS